METTKTIKFSNEYHKLYHQDHAILIAMFKTNKTRLSDMLLSYDTIYTENNEIKYYELPEGDLIYLLFLGNFNIPFSTIRKYTPKRFMYYEKCMRQKFILQRTQDKYDSTELNDNYNTPDGWRRKDNNEHEHK